MVIAKWFIVSLMGIALLLGFCPDAIAANLDNGARIFEIHCAGCHGNGGNIVRRGKTLQMKALQRYHMDSVEAIAQLVAHGKGNMSAYQDRLNPTDIQDVAAYVLERAAQKWR